MGKARREIDCIVRDPTKYVAFYYRTIVLSCLYASRKRSDEMIYGNTAPPRKVPVLGNQVHTSRVIFGAAIGDQIRGMPGMF
jgi:hypothetical protein